MLVPLVVLVLKVMQQRLCWHHLIGAAGTAAQVTNSGDANMLSLTLLSLREIKVRRSLMALMVPLVLTVPLEIKAIRVLQLLST